MTVFPPLPSGFVSLVGAGPGDPDLLTVKALRCLRRAEVVAYDRLVSPEILSEAAQECERIFVGKHGGGVSWKQEEINQLLIDKARAGHYVVRLKGGDPFVFGRGSEEALALKEAGVRYEVVPGISSSLAVPAYAGIPVTHRHVSTSFTVVTGHEDPSKAESTLNWPALAASETLVVLMGVARLEAITQTLIEHGMRPSTPAAMIRWGTTSKQQTVTANLATIAQRVAEAKLKAPATLIIGEVAALHETLAWFEADAAHPDQIISSVPTTHTIPIGKSAL